MSTIPLALPRWPSEGGGWGKGCGVAGSKKVAYGARLGLFVWLLESPLQKSGWLVAVLVDSRGNSPTEP